MENDARAQRILECFPLVSRIQDAALKQAVIACWIRVWEESGLSDPTDCPFTVLFPELTLVQHINCVGELVLAAADTMERHNPGLRLDRDFLLTGVLLHDVSKLVEIERGPDGLSWGPLLKLMPHGMYGAIVAVAQGLPPRVANIILSHTRMTNTLPASPEAVLLHYLDYGLADVLRAHRGMHLILDGGPKLGR